MSQDTDALREAAKGFLGHSTQSRPPFTDEEADAWLARGSADALALKAAIAAALSTAPAPAPVQAVLKAARGWLGDRHPEGADEELLFLALSDVFPEDFGGKEGCTCGEPATCDECPSKAEVDAYLGDLRRKHFRTATAPAEGERT